MAAASVSRQLLHRMINDSALTHSAFAILQAAAGPAADSLHAAAPVATVSAR
jgi:hypothetical protein